MCEAMNGELMDDDIWLESTVPSSSQNFSTDGKFEFDDDRYNLTLLPKNPIFGSDLNWLQTNTSINLSIESLRNALEMCAPPTAMRNALAIAAYSIIFFISLFGNIMVCQIIVCNRKLHTFTNFFIANLAVSDLLMTMVNVPFGAARLLLDNWPFGNFLCKCLPFIQATSVYVSTMTMCIISIDRYCVVVYPLGARITNVVPLGLVLAIIWLISCALAVPFAFYAAVNSKDFKMYNISVYTLVRCQSISQSQSYDQGLTLFAFLTQYLVPLTIASIAYSSIAFHIKNRSRLGAMTPEQIDRILRTNRQTITMLVLVLIVFAATWLPLHFFNLYREFVNSNLHNLEVYIAAHWFAMSSICYNSFIYSARNRHFRNGMKNFFRYLVFKRRDSSSLNGGAFALEHSNAPTQLTSVPSTRVRNHLCNLNRNHNCSRSFCLPRANDNVLSSSSSLHEENNRQTLNDANVCPLTNGKHLTGGGHTVRPIVNGRSSSSVEAKLSLPLMGSRPQQTPNGGKHRPVEPQSARIDSCEIPNQLSNSAPHTPKSAPKECNSIATADKRPDDQPDRNMSEESKV